MYLEPCEKFKKKFEIKNEKIIFKSHEEIDKFVLNLIEKESDFLNLKEYL